MIKLKVITGCSPMDIENNYDNWVNLLYSNSIEIDVVKTDLTSNLYKNYMSNYNNQTYNTDYYVTGEMVDYILLVEYKEITRQSKIKSVLKEEGSV